MLKHRCVSQFHFRLYHEYSFLFLLTHESQDDEEVGSMKKTLSSVVSPSALSHLQQPQFHRSSSVHLPELFSLVHLVAFNMLVC